MTGTYNSRVRVFSGRTGEFLRLETQHGETLASLHDGKLEVLPLGLKQGLAGLGNISLVRFDLVDKFKEAFK